MLRQTAQVNGKGVCTLNTPGEVVKRRIFFSDHARAEARRRGIKADIVLEVAATPEQRMPSRRGREVRQSRIVHPDSGKLLLVRVVVEPGPEAELIVTVYRTSKMRKYWRVQ